MNRCLIACRQLPDGPRGPRIVYLTGWQMMTGPTWTRDRRAAEVLAGTEQDAGRWLADLEREGIDGAQVVTEEN